MEADFSQIEVRIASIYTNDPVLIAEATSESADMHRDTSLDIWQIPLEEMTKEVRAISKGINFGLFYGLGYKSLTANLWKQVDTKLKSGITLKEHITSFGIRNFSNFEQYCKEYEHRFWFDRFSVYRQWKEDINNFYIKHGFIENKLGFRFVSYMGEREVSNYPIQSAAFHCLLTSIILINNIAKEEKWKSKIVSQIHDSVIGDIHPSEADHIFQTCKYIMSEKLREIYPWISVPLPVEIECTDIDQPWSTKKEIEI
jgi:DNA polymerase-1